YAVKKDIVIALEPQSKTNLNNLNTTQEGLQWIDNLNIPNLFLMLDTYHMDVEELSVVTSFIEARGRVKHVHIADSNRRIPGEGNINFLEVLKLLKTINYDGFLSLEIAQGTDGLSAAAKSWKYLNYICRELI
ncbi:MAG: sugar phosphate isomerase/epimerase, partial [Clostridiales bacterium]|nr:sugar phosphate isomerase/epimerase [Clostridiales bacterium]